MRSMVNGSKKAPSLEGRVVGVGLFALLRMGMGAGKDEDHSFCITADEWPSLYRLAGEQAVLGIVLEGARQIDKESYPPRRILLPWIGQVEQIKRRNMQMDALCADVSRMLDSVGIGCRILKGQGVARLYPNPGLRQSGDIDAWVMADGWQGGIDGSIKEIESRIRSLGVGRTDEIVYHHLHWHLPQVEVEVHYRPQMFNNPLANRRFQRWCREHWEDCDGHDGFTVPSAEFNAVYLLAHLFHHLLFEGVGLRQLCDYFALLQSAGLEKRGEAAQAISRFGMTRFARGVMWVLQEVFRMDGDKMLVEPDEREGRLILAEMLCAGNFGHNLTPRGIGESTLRRFIRLTRYRSSYLVRYPAEILWDIPFRLYHFAWRRVYG